MHLWLFTDNACMFRLRFAANHRVYSIIEYNKKFVCRICPKIWVYKSYKILKIQVPIKPLYGKITRPIQQRILQTQLVIISSWFASPVLEFYNIL